MTITLKLLINDVRWHVFIVEICEICGIHNFTDKSKFINHFFRHEKENQYTFFKSVYECDAMFGVFCFERRYVGAETLERT